MRTFVALALICVALAAPNGGWKAVETTGLTADPTFQKVANFGISQIGTQIPALASGKWEISKIYTVHTQVVSGLNYKIECQVKNAQGETQDVAMVVYYQPWTGTLELVSANEGSNTEFATVGGWKTLSGEQLSITENKGLASAIQVAMETLSADALFAGKGWAIQRIISVQTQVVAGLNYKINVQLINAQGQSQKMEFVVYSQPWTNTFTLTSSTVVGN